MASNTNIIIRQDRECVGVGKMRDNEGGCWLTWYSSKGSGACLRPHLDETGKSIKSMIFFVQIITMK